MVDLSVKPYYLNKDQIKYVENTVKNMSTDEKVGQLFFVIGQDENKVDIKEFIKKYQPSLKMNLFRFKKAL